MMWSAGEIIFKDTMNSPIAGILSADYRMDGKEEGIFLQSIYTYTINIYNSQAEAFFNIHMDYYYPIF